MTELSGEIHRIVRNWYVPGALAVVGVGSVALWSRPLPVDLLSRIATIWALVMLPLSLHKNAFRRRVPARFRASRSALEIDGKVIAVERIVEAKLLPSRLGKMELALVLEDGRLNLAIDDALVRPFVDVLAIGPGQRRATFATASRARDRWLAVLAYVVLGALIGYVPWHVRGVALLVVEGAQVGAVAALAIAIGRQKVVIEAGGFTVRFLHRRRYHAFADVVAIEPHFDDETRVVLRSGEQVVLKALEVRDAHGVGMGNPRALFEHLWAAFARRTTAPRS